jgi:GMP synthase (glutamine-hydrolysing)
VRLLALTHGPTVRPELFGDVVREAGNELVEWELPSRGAPPADGFDAVLVFGGRMNVGEELEHPWLRDEYELLRGWVEGGTPVLGVCLGAQTLAHAHGGRVAPLPVRQGGFVEASLTDEGAADPVLGVLPPRFDALVANGYAFEVPAGAAELATSAVCPQAFRLGERAWGVQFHPEVRRSQVLAWFNDGRRLPRPIEEIEREVDAGIERWHELGRSLCVAFLDASGA